MIITKIIYNSIRRLHVKYEMKHDEIILNKINIFIGENGSGKSTIIDIVRSLTDLNVIPSLIKENQLTSSQPYYGVEFDDGSIKFVSAAGANESEHSVTKYISCRITDSKDLFCGDISKFDINENKKILNNVSFNLTNEINYRACQTASLEKPNKHYISELNKIESILNGTFDRASVKDIPFIPINTRNLIEREDGFIASWFKEDKEMPNALPITWFPSGWRSYAEVTSFLLKCKKGSVCLLEEPEVSLHPRLQRLLLKRIIEISTENDLQILLSTHSAAMINSALDNHVTIYHSKGEKIEPICNVKGLLDELGYKASDILQTNCIIWVEGPSDRIYIKHWLLHINKELIEGEDFEFLFYGGRTLSHFDLNEIGDDMISMLKINTNAIIVMDSDKKNENSELNRTKRKIIEYCNENNSISWVTEGREIENYLDPEILKQAISHVHPQFIKHIKTGKWSNLLKFTIDNIPKAADKVKVAKKYVALCSENISYRYDLEKRILELNDFITHKRN